MHIKHLTYTEEGGNLYLPSPLIQVTPQEALMSLVAFPGCSFAKSKDYSFLESNTFPLLFFHPALGMSRTYQHFLPHPFCFYLVH